MVMPSPGIVTEPHFTSSAIPKPRMVQPAICTIVLMGRFSEAIHSVSIILRSMSIPKKKNHKLKELHPLKVTSQYQYQYLHAYEDNIHHYGIFVMVPVTEIQPFLSSSIWRQSCKTRAKTLASSCLGTVLTAATMP